MSHFALLALLIHGASGGAIQSRVAPPTAQGDSMRVELVVPAKVRLGQPVRLVLKVSNVSDRPITLYLQGRPTAFDLIVEHRDGGVVWRRLEGATVSAILGVRTLEPGQTLELEDTWTQRNAAGEPIEPGDYTVSGSVLTDGEPLRTPAIRLRITA